MNAPTRYPPQKGIWTLIAPDGRKWEGSSGLEVAAKEQRERIPASVALERIYRAMDDENPTPETRESPADIVGALQDKAHTDAGPFRAGRSVKETGVADA